MLPDITLLRIFDFYLDKAPLEAWHTLVHVCRTWRNVVFGSPRRLNLRLHCGASTPVKEKLDVWPVLPIQIGTSGIDRWGSNNIIAALEHKDRICHLLILKKPSLEMDKVLAALQHPLPALTFLFFESDVETSASFLGGSAPALQSIHLRSIPFLGFPKLLLSATHLQTLDLWNISHSGYISPEAMVACLSVLTRLENLHIGFESPRSHPDLHPPPPTRAHLPVLTVLRFEGVAEYLDDLLAQIDIPLLDNLRITFFHRRIFDTPHLTQLLSKRISRTPKFKTHCDARVEFSGWDVIVALPQTFDGVTELGIAYRPRSSWEPSSVVKLCGSPFPPALIPVVEHLYITQSFYSGSQPEWRETNQWLRLFRPFTDVKNLYISSELTSYIARALQELVGVLGERVKEVLPALQTLFLEEPLRPGHVREAIEQFVAARQLSGHPILVSRWERKRMDGREP
jgi:hypothetical protein